METNKALVRRVLEAGVNAHDPAFIRGVLAPGYTRHSRATTEMPEITSVDQFMEFLRVSFEAFPDWHEEVLLMVAEGDKVAYVTRGTATHTGPMGDIPATGKSVEVVNHIVQRVEDGKIAETWIEWDNLDVMTQLGLVEGPGGEDG